MCAPEVIGKISIWRYERKNRKNGSRNRAMQEKNERNESRVGKRQKKNEKNYLKD